jgi:hypothetical protein
MTKRHALRSLETPVRDSGALALRCLHDNAALDFFTSLNGAGHDIALARGTVHPDR